MGAFDQSYQIHWNRERPVWHFSFNKKSEKATVEPLGTDTSLIRTPIYYGQLYVPTIFSYIYFPNPNAEAKN